MTTVEDLKKALLEKEKTSWQISFAMTVDGQTLLSPQEQWIRKKDVEAFLVELRKQLSERVLEIDEPSNDYSKVYQQNRQYRTLLKELLEAQK
jgi:frataxin-like iron-binding protein CyaY